RSNQDDVLNISTSFFVTNFPEQTTAKELWRLCKQYGNVNVFIPNRRSKLGSHSFNPSAIVKPASDASYKKVESRPSSSYIQAAKVGISSLSDAKALKPALVLDDSCAHEPDLALSLVGKVFLIRIKELTGWAPSFNDDSDSDDESVDSQEASILKDEFSAKNSDMEEIPETVFDKSEHVGNISPACNEVRMETRVDEKSEDPFNIYDMLNKKKPTKSIEHSDSDIQYPPRFTPCDRPQVNSNLDHINQTKVLDKEPGAKASFQEDVNVSGCSGHFQSVKASKSGGSILHIIEDFIKVGQTMGYKMEGRIKDFKEIVSSQGETKMEKVDLFNIKACWGNINFDYVLLNNKKLLVISVYAPQELVEKKSLWKYLNLLISRWNGDVLLMGDFNEVCLKKERYGSIFNSRGAAAFNSFIVDSGLVKVPSGGFSFIWSHRPILLRELNETKSFLSLRLETILMTKFWERLALKPNGVSFSRLRRNIRGGAEQVQMASLLSLLEGLILPNMIDRWMWLISGDREFSFSSIRNYIDDKILGTVSSKTQWCKFFPIKVNISSWRIELNNLPTRLNLYRRGLELQTILCPSCNFAVESTDHLFFSCSMMKELYASIAKWWDVNMPDFSSFEEWWEWFSNFRLSSKLKMLLEGVFYVAWWLDWNFCNKSIFGPNIPLKAHLFNDVVVFSLSWCRSRRGGGGGIGMDVVGDVLLEESALFEDDGVDGVKDCDVKESHVVCVDVEDGGSVCFGFLFDNVQSIIEAAMGKFLVITGFPPFLLRQAKRNEKPGTISKTGAAKSYPGSFPQRGLNALLGIKRI
nr:RNA-directed DNA polymerase, eukaryota [Tanacetum cinerariifolium]